MHPRMERRREEEDPRRRSAKGRGGDDEEDQDPRKLKEKRKSEKISSDNDSSSDMVKMGNGFALYKGLHDELYEHQKTGILFLWKLHSSKSGGILADNMGKKIQIIGFLDGLFRMEKTKSVLIVMPLDRITHWKEKFQDLAPQLNIETYGTKQARILHGSWTKTKQEALRAVQRKNGILITSYRTVQTSWKELSANSDNRQFIWDYIILDEGHKIKNHTNKTAKALREIQTRKSVILTGIAPNFDREMWMWAFFDFTHKGLLGTQETFTNKYVKPILRARGKKASVSEKQLGKKMEKRLRKLIQPSLLTQPSLLRRTEDDIEMLRQDDGEERRGSLSVL